MDIQNEYRELVHELYWKGAPKEDRTGTGTKSVFGRTIRHDMKFGFPMLTAKKISFNAALTEILWILQGRTDMEYLIENGVNYWNADYKRSGRTDHTLGPVYGKQWRDFGGVDQLENLLEQISVNPNSRCLMVSAWNPIDMPDMALPPCHYGFQVYINNGTIDLMWQQRSVDVFLGLPYDIAMYGLLLEFIAKGMDLIPGQLIGQLGDCHLYNNHINQASEYLSRTTFKLPTLKLKKGLYLENSNVVIPTHKLVSLNNYESHPAIKAPLSVG
jgi:thymidylate synthase